MQRPSNHLVWACFFENKTMNTNTKSLQEELKFRETLGLKPMTRAELATRLKSLGYKMERGSDHAYVARYMSGPAAGRTYPAISTYVIEVDTGKGFANVEARRDKNFEELQRLRREGSLFAVVRGSLLEI